MDSTTSASAPTPKLWRRADAGAEGTSFDPLRLRQARHLARFSVEQLAKAVGVSATAIKQWEAGVYPPKPDNRQILARALGQSARFFEEGRPLSAVDSATAHLDGLRPGGVADCRCSHALAGRAGEVIGAIEKRVTLPPVDLPACGASGFATPAGYGHHVAERVDAGGGRGIIRALERHGVVVGGMAPSLGGSGSVCSLSAWVDDRPIILLREETWGHPRMYLRLVHELGHLLMHRELNPAECPRGETEAAQFARAFLTSAVARDPGAVGADEQDGPALLRAAAAYAFRTAGTTLRQIAHEIRVEPTWIRQLLLDRSLVDDDGAVDAAREDR